MFDYPCIFELFILDYPCCHVVDLQLPAAAPRADFAVTLRALAARDSPRAKEQTFPNLAIYSALMVVYYGSI